MSLGDSLWERLLQPIDIYCERTDPSFFAEPLGFLSNLGFFPAAALIYWTARRSSSPVKRKRLEVLALLALLIGIGSGLFHSIPNLLTMAADVIPISCFALVFILFLFSFRREEGQAIKKPLALVLALIILPGLLARWSGLLPFLGGGEFYSGLGPAMLFLSASDRVQRRARWLVVGAVLFFLAFAARTMDMHVCSRLPFGTHFLWHLVNSTVVIALALALEASPDSRASVPFTPQRSSDPDRSSL